MAWRDRMCNYEYSCALTRVSISDIPAIDQVSIPVPFTVGLLFTYP